ncbi:PREDICTED: ribosomal protein L11 methyltransferase-like [Fragaria vesca subsp. vesca]
MSGGPWLKHLASTLTSRAFTLSRPPSRFFTTHKPRNLSRPNSFNAVYISTSSTTSSETPAPQPFALPFQSVNILCQRHVSDMLQDALLCFGATSTSVDEDDDNEDSNEVAVYFLINMQICITSIFPEGEDVDTCISHAADSISLKEIPRYEVTIGEQYDWIKKTQESFHPVEITEGLWIVPSWKTPPNAQATNIILNPGLAFGTGEHPTTRLCLLLLHGLIKGGEKFLDYGTGSGILAIAAVKFGAALSVGIDIDPQAITSAHQNATLNNIGPEEMQLYIVPSENCSVWTDPCRYVEERSSSGVEAISETDKYDVLIANILLNPLMDLADQIVSYAKPGAVIGLSGILSEQLPYITERYSQFLEGISTTEMDGWVCVHGRKKQIVPGN